MAKKPTVDELADAIGQAYRAATGQWKEATPTPEEKYAAEVARVAFMSACPFYAHYFYAELKEVFTHDVPTAATDGRHVFINPTYLHSLKPAERVFVYAHEVDHAISRHPQRMKHYRREGELRGLGIDQEQMNHAMDYVINAGLLANGIGMMNPSWLFDPQTTGDMLWEDVYERHYKKPPEGQGNGGGGGQKGKTYGQTGSSSKGHGNDPSADAQGGGFDQVFEPHVDPVTGKEDIPTEAEFKEAVARAAGAAKAMGKMPGYLQRKVDAILEPQINWREHLRTLMTGKIGARRETWDRPNRRRLALNPIVIMPGRAGHGAGTVCCVVDNSGSISEKELSAFFAEVGGVMADVRPKRVILIWCDAQVRQVDEATTLDELSHIRAKGSPGGGGTSFIPPFEYLKEHNIRPETTVYITDMMGSFPDGADHPVIWCKTTDIEAPFGDQVRIKV